MFRFCLVIESEYMTTTTQWLNARSMKEANEKVDNALALYAASTNHAPVSGVKITFDRLNFMRTARS